MAVTEAAPASGAISREQAAGLLDAQEAPETAVEAPAEEAPAEEEQQPTEEAGGAEETAAEAPEGEEELTPETDETEGEAQAQPLPAPQFWTAEQKADWSELSPKVQETILSQERSRVAASSKAFEEAARIRAEADAATQHAVYLAAQAQAAIQAAPGVDQETAPRLMDPSTGQPLTWGQIDWDAFYASDPQSAGAFRTIYNERVKAIDAHRNSLAQAAVQAQAHADAQALNAYVYSEAGKLAQLNPKLLGDGAKRSAIGEYLVEQGIPKAALKGIGAAELVLAEKAMNWDRLNAGKTTAPAKPNTQQRTPARPGVRPTGAAPAATPPKRATQEAGNRFAQTRGKDDAIALLNARSGA